MQASDVRQDGGVAALGLSEEDPRVLGEHVVAAWDAFVDVAEGSDLDRPSRLPGWSGKDVCIHLGSWPQRTPLTGLLHSARNGGVGETPDLDAENAALVSAHRDASRDEVMAALIRARDTIEEFFESDEPDEVGRLPARSSLGPLPVLSLIHASSYELAVHALDLAPCGAPAPAPHLLDRGLAALLDVTGALAARLGIEATVTAQAGDAGWAFTAEGGGWTTDVARPGFEGAGAKGSAADLLDASAGRAALPVLLVTRRLVVQDMAAFMRLAPLVNEVPGLPGGAALRTGISGLGKVTGLLGRLRR